MVDAEAAPWVRTAMAAAAVSTAGVLTKKYPAGGYASWTPIQGADLGIVAFQWDGGPNYAIHGHSTRYLPELNLQGLRGIRERPPTIVIRLLADGYSRREIILPVELTRDPSMPYPEDIPPSGSNTGTSGPAGHARF